MYIRDGCDPAVRLLLKRLPGTRRTLETEARANIGHDVIRSWRYRSSPQVHNLRAALNVLGLDLAVVDLATREVVQ